MKIKELQALPRSILESRGYRMWDKNIMLIPLKELQYIADGEILHCIDGQLYTKGKDSIDEDTRGGLIAYGFAYDEERPDENVQAIVLPHY